jgi:hybrid cluster-associated redox disulfide protein
MAKKKTKESSKEITKDMTLAEIIEKNPAMAEHLVDEGLYCGGCPLSSFETLENGALGHGLDPDELLASLNEKSKEKPAKNRK